MNLMTHEDFVSMFRIFQDFEKLIKDYAYDKYIKSRNKAVISTGWFYVSDFNVNIEDGTVLVVIKDGYTAPWTDDCEEYEERIEDILAWYNRKELNN